MGGGGGMGGIRGGGEGKRGVEQRETMQLLIGTRRPCVCGGMGS